MSIEDYNPENENPTPLSINSKSEDEFTFESEGNPNFPIEVEEEESTVSDEPEPSSETAQEKAERLYGDKYDIENVSESGNIGNATVTYQGARYIFSFPLKEDD